MSKNTTATFWTLH